jgi:phosphopantetheinyl transferase
LDNACQCRVSLENLYRNLFHGPLFQGVFSIGQCGDQGIEAKVRVLPRGGLFRSNPDPQFLVDPVFIDVVLHPLAGWHLEQRDQAGRILLPYELPVIRFYGPCPPVGEVLSSRGLVEHMSPRRFVHAVEAVDADGRLWCRLKVRYWRFYFPFGEVHFHGPKDAYFLSKDWLDVLPNPDSGTRGLPEAWCMRLEPPHDMLQPAMQLVGARVTLSPDEFEQYRALEKPEDKRAEWLFGRIVAKDAVRSLWRERTGERLFPADVEIEGDRYGRPLASARDPEQTEPFPNVSISHTEGVVAALAAFHPHVGIDVERIEPREASFERIAFDATERKLLDGFGADRDEGITRLWCAKEAVAKATGRGLAEGPRSVLVRAADPSSGEVQVQLGPTRAAELRELRDANLRVRTIREDTLIVATTLCEKAAT